VLEARAQVPDALTQLEAGNRLNLRMRDMDLSMRDVAKRFPHPVSALAQLSMWVNGFRNPSPEMRPALAAALEMSQLELEAMLPRPRRRSREPGAEWRCTRHQVAQETSEAALEEVV